MLVKLVQTLFLALLQGVTELFPISSLGHTIILPALIGQLSVDWKDLGTNEAFLPLVVALHLGTSIALLIYFWRDWFQVGKTLVSTVKQGGKVNRGTDEWVSWLIIVGTVPAGLLGLLFEKQVCANKVSPYFGLDDPALVVELAQGIGERNPSLNGIRCYGRYLSIWAE